MVACVECLPADKPWDVVSVTRRSSGVAPRACVRVYARVLVPPNLYIHGGLCGMPACGQAVGCGVCDTLDLWCGAAGLCARVRACAGAAESLHTYISTILARS